MNMINEILYALRKRAEEVNAECRDYFSSDLCGMCLICSTAITLAFRRFKVRGAKLIYGKCCEGCHCWVELGGYIIDITATQFSNGFKEVFGRKPMTVEILRITPEVRKAYVPEERININKAYSWAMDTGWPVYQVPDPKLVRKLINGLNL